LSYRPAGTRASCSASSSAKVSEDKKASQGTSSFYFIFSKCSQCPTSHKAS